MSQSASSARLWALALVVVFLSAGPWMALLSDASPTAEASASASASASVATSAASASFERAADRRQRHHHRSHTHRDAGANSGPHSWCPHCGLQPPPQPPPPPMEDGEVDPRYGVEKRLVPTGPNPLHN